MCGQGPTLVPGQFGKKKWNALQLLARWAGRNSVADSSRTMIGVARDVSHGYDRTARATF